MAFNDDMDRQSEYVSEPPDELFKILEYLPNEFSDETEKQYIDALMLAAQTSYKNNLYQFAYVQYHMLFMTAVYYTLLKVSILHKDDFDNALYYLLKRSYSKFWKKENTKAGNLYFGSFAVINESDVFMLLSVVGRNIIGRDNSLLGDLKKLVEGRNKYAHANGRFLLTSDELFMEAINKYNKHIQRVVNLVRNDLTNFYKMTICDSIFYDPTIRAYTDPEEHMMQEIIKKYFLSKVELNWLRKIRLSEFDDHKDAVEIKTLHHALMQYYKRLA